MRGQSFKRVCLHACMYVRVYVWMHVCVACLIFSCGSLPTDPDSCGADPEVRSEASWAVLNATSCGSDHQVCCSLSAAAVVCCGVDVDGGGANRCCCCWFNACFMFRNVVGRGFRWQHLMHDTTSCCVAHPPRWLPLPFVTRLSIWCKRAE